MINDMDRASTQDIKLTFTGSPDVSSDSIKLIVKSNISDPDDDAIMSIEADVATSGSTGIAYLEITKDSSDVAVGKYYYDIYYYPNDTPDKQYLLEKGSFKIKERTSDKRTS